MNVTEGSMKKNFTGSGTLVSPTGAGGLKLMGVFVSQASNTPTLQLADASGNIANTFTPVAPGQYWFPCDVSGTLAITIGGTVDCTVLYGPS